MTYLICRIWKGMAQINLFKSRNKLTDLDKELTVEGEGWGEGIVKKFGINMYKLLYLKWITNEDPLCSMLCGSCYVACEDLLSMGLSWQEYWSRLPFPPPGGSSWPRDRKRVSWSFCIGSWILCPPRGEGIHVYVWLSPFAVHLKLSQHC